MTKNTLAPLETFCLERDIETAKKEGTLAVLCLAYSEGYCGYVCRLDWDYMGEEPERPYRLAIVEGTHSNAWSSANSRTVDAAGELGMRYLSSIPECSKSEWTR